MTKTDTPAPAASLQQSDPMAEMLASLTPADLSLFTSPSKGPKVNEYIPFVTKSLEGKNAEGEGAPFQFPCTYGDSSGVSAKLRRAGREKGVSVQLRWQPVDAAAWPDVLKACDTTAEDSEPGKLARKVRDESAGRLAFRAVPQVSRKGGQAVVA